MSDSDSPSRQNSGAEPRPKRRPRYTGKNPRTFELKYKEHQPERYPETVAKVVASGKTPAGTHVPILLNEILEVLDLRPGQKILDCTLGYGSHAKALLTKIQPNGFLLGLDVDPIEQPKTLARLRAQGFGEDVFRTQRCNYAGIRHCLALEGLTGVDGVIADLGVSSMQLDEGERGFSVKLNGPLDMRMNPQKGISASQLIQQSTPEKLADWLSDYSDEPQAQVIAHKIAGRLFPHTTDLSACLKHLLQSLGEEEAALSIRRTFQALRIEVNQEFPALETLLNHLPSCLNSGALVAILTFHSGEDRRVKKAFQRDLLAGHYAAISDPVIRPQAAECFANPRARAAKLRWARK